jgi:large subunit ribosomal protein L4
VSVHADRGSLAICDPASYETPSTKAAASALGELSGRVLVVVGADDANCAKSFRNIKGVSVRAADNVGVADVIGASRLIITPTALEHLTGVAS